ncbi:retrovirus-related pol polyprotein from transposon TNT 1-94, partial [Tanacetum coccineum]
NLELSVLQMMKVLIIGNSRIRRLLFNEWEWFTSDGESIESLLSPFLKLMHDLRETNNFPERLLVIFKFLNKLPSRMESASRFAQRVEYGQDRQMRYGWSYGGRESWGNIGVQNIGNGNIVAAGLEGNANGNNGNQIRCYNYRGLGHLARNCTVRPRRRDAAYLQTQLLIAQKEEAGINSKRKSVICWLVEQILMKLWMSNANCI